MYIRSIYKVKSELRLISFAIHGAPCDCQSRDTRIRHDRDKFLTRQSDKKKDKIDNEANFSRKFSFSRAKGALEIEGTRGQFRRVEETGEFYQSDR